MKDIFTPDDFVKNTEDFEHEIDIFKTAENDHKKEIRRKEKYYKNDKASVKKSKKNKLKSEIAKYIEM